MSYELNKHRITCTKHAKQAQQIVKQAQKSTTVHKQLVKEKNKLTQQNKTYKYIKLSYKK